MGEDYTYIKYYNKYDPFASCGPFSWSGKSKSYKSYVSDISDSCDMSPEPSYIPLTAIREEDLDLVDSWTARYTEPEELYDEHIVDRTNL